MKEPVIVLTGATDGLGRAVAAELARRPGTTLYLHGRSQKKLDELERDLSDASATIRTVLADFSELSQVRELAAKIAATTDYVTVLVNNAGIGAGDGVREESADGHELRFAVNYLAPTVLTAELIPLLERGAPARIVNVASLGQQPIDYDDLPLQQGYDGHRAYTRSKFAVVAAGFALAQQLDPSAITVNSLHPATFMPTKMVLDTGANSIDTLETGVEATLRLILDPALDAVTGEFFNKTETARAHERSYDINEQARLQEATAQLIGASSAD